MVLVFWWVEPNLLDALVVMLDFMLNVEIKPVDCVDS